MSTSSDILQEYVKLTNFLGRVLGPDYEVVVHDLTDPSHSIIAIANGHISGREVGSPLTNMALAVLKDGSYQDADYRTGDSGLSAAGRRLRSNTLFIKHEGQLVGMLCINFDDSRYQAAAEQVMSLAQSNLPPENTARQGEAHGAGTLSISDMTEKYNTSPEELTADAINRELERLGVGADRLTAEERMAVIAALEAQGLFLLKGVVKDVALGLRCSQASVYRYMSQLKINGAA